MKKRLIVLFFVVLLAASNAWGEEIKSHDFNDRTFGGMNVGSYWSIQPSGGVGNSPYARLRYPDYGTANKAMQVGTASYNTDVLWIEANVRAVGNPSGGSKFIKVFGMDPNVSWNNTSNLTFGLDYNTNTNRGVSYYVDTDCVVMWEGTNLGGGNHPECDNATYHTTSSSIDIRGTTWHHYKVYVKRADYMQGNGEVKVWFNGVLRAHATGMYSHQTTSAYIKYVEFGGYNHNNFSGEEWYFDVDNVYVGTTEKGSISDPVDPPPPSEECDNQHLWLCGTWSECLSAGGFWYGDECHEDEYIAPPSEPITGNVVLRRGGATVKAANIVAP